MDIARVARSKAEAKASYDKMARYYNYFGGQFERRFRQAGLKLLDPRPGEDVLEVGYGTGEALAEIASAASPGHVCGIDISDGMREEAEKCLEAKGVTRAVSLATGDAASLPYRADSFDAIFMSFTLELFDTPEIPQVLAECARVLKPSGRIVVVAMALPDHPKTMSRLYVWSHKHFPNYVDCRPIPAAEMIAEAGFNLEGEERLSMWGLPVDVVLAKRT
ncbi:MAG: 2-heptaprenyl-1,4-naphthoquinone methyltransferase [Acidobacteria bacterium]|nr:MAG: 2-heptaprenyl-1,4-naphthoquinone methyltransferase [Acidobacteriota bacterium]